MIDPIELHEHGRVVVPDSVVAATPAAFWKSADCKVTKSSADGLWVLKAGNSVGVARMRTTAGDVTLQIKPKLDTADVFFMADYAYEQRQNPLKLLDRNDVGFEAVLGDPTACLLVWYARAIWAFASRWLRRDYESRVRVLDGKVKGRILVSQYVGRHLAVGDAARIPCRVQERTQDTPNNRVLKAGLRFIASVSHDLPVAAAQRAVLRQVNAALPLFAAVSDIRFSPADIRATSTRGPQRHYAAVLGATINLLQNRFMGEELSEAYLISSFMWSMPVLFQESVRGLLDSAPDIVLVNETPGTARIFDANGARILSSKVAPDLTVRINDGRALLIDTKYKDALPTNQNTNDEDEIATPGGSHRIKVSRSDVYQVVAYRQHERWPDSTVALLYPVVLAAHESLPAPMRIDGFGMPVILIFIDIGSYGRRNLPTFLSTVRRLVAT